MKKSIISFYSLLTGAVAGAFGIGKIIGKRVEENQEISDKYRSLFLMMNQWVKVKQEGKDLTLYFEQNGYREIAIYGMGQVGTTLANELVNSTIKIKYGIDQNTSIASEGFDIISPEEVLEPVDVIVVTPITFLAQIEELLSKKINCPIISLEDILYEIF